MIYAQIQPTATKRAGEAALFVATKRPRDN
jgi:hypothetical protein